MFEVYFRRSNGEDEFLANCNDFYTADSVINHSRMWISAPGHLKIDVGSHTEFFIIKGPVEKIMNKIIARED